MSRKDDVRTRTQIGRADAFELTLPAGEARIDVTARELQRKDVQYTRAKGFDTFAPLGPCIAIGVDPANLAIEGWVNGEKRQSSNTNQLIFAVPELIGGAADLSESNLTDIKGEPAKAGGNPAREPQEVSMRSKSLLRAYGMRQSTAL